MAPFLTAVAAVFRLVDRLTTDLWASARSAVRLWADGPLQGVLFTAVVVLTGLRIVVSDALRALDGVVAWVERGFVFVAMLAMTALAFNEYLARELRPRFGDMGGLWALEGQMNVALLLMVVVGFLGASLATRQRKHIAVDALDRVLSPAPARTVKRLTAAVAAGLCAIFARGSWHAVFSHSQDAFEGAKVWGWMASPINLLVSAMPGDKVGPGSCRELDEAAHQAAGCPEVQFGSTDDWIDAQYDAGLDPFELFSFAYVDPGDRFPLWIPLLLLVVAFALMAARFGAQVFVPVPAAKRVSGIVESRPGSRRPADVVLAGAFPGALIALGLGAYFGQGPVILLASILLVFLGSPLFVAVGVGTLACWVLLRGGNAETVVSDMFEATKKQELLAIPFFVLAGNLMTRGSIASRLIAVARAAVGWLPGGLGASAVAACAFFAAISGSSPVTVIAIGTIMFPMLLQEKYPEGYSIGVLTTAGGLGIIIPPSIPMIVYAIMVSGNPAVGVIDPAVLFKAGIGPGLFIASMLVLYTFFIMWPRTEAQWSAHEIPDLSTWARDAGHTVLRGIPSLMLPVLILGGIYGWLSFGDLSLSFTVTEAAAIAVVYALAVELFIHRELKWRDLPEVFADSSVMMGSLFVILVIAISLNRFFVFEQVPEQATEWMLARVDSKVGFLIVVNLFLLALGCVMDILSAILIVAPLLAPIAASYGIHPVHFGIMFIVNLELGYLTPPMGINLFVASTVFDRGILEVIRAVLPFLLLMLFCLVIIVWVPQLSLFLVE